MTALLIILKALEALENDLRDHGHLDAADRIHLVWKRFNSEGVKAFNG